MIDSSGVESPAYFLSAGIIAPNGEAVPKGITMESHGAKESISCVLTNRGSSPRAGVPSKATTP
ncbi:MAG TPA: hypothetical protein VF105_04530 [Gemmatimonadaceae bacterium]